MSRSASATWATATLVALALAPPPAAAQLKNCANLSANPGDYKIVLDDFAYSSAAASNDADLTALKERLQFSFNGQLIALKASARQLDRTLQVPLRLVVCSGRQPSLDGQEFTAALAERLSDERVVVEMWGTLDLRTASGGTATRRATIGYVIPPVKHYVSEDVAPPIYLVAYPKVGAAQSDDELENLPELSAFALVGLGTKAARANRYDLAVWAFNRAETSLLEAQLAGRSDDVDSLLAYVRRAACDTRASARGDSNYVGALQMSPVQDCRAPP